MMWLRRYRRQRWFSRLVADSPALREAILDARQERAHALTTIDPSELATVDQMRSVSRPANAKRDRGP